MDIYSEVGRFYRAYAGEKCIIGKSVCGRDLYAFFAGTHEGAQGICQYSMHAREWICTKLALLHISRGVARGGMWFVPLVNPDGALLATEGLESVPKARRERLIALNGCEDFSLWKANAEGVDLNVNFPARWGTGKQNVFAPAPQNFVGDSPLCAPESRALAEFTLRHAPDYTLSFHTKGEEIYWRFHQPPMRLRRDFRLAKKLQKLTGYSLKEAPHSAGGYKDWCVEKLKIPAFTIEAGCDLLSHPLGEESLAGIAFHLESAVQKFSEEF